MTTFGETVFECPVCEEEVPGKVLHSTNQMGQDSDFCPVTMGVHAVPLVINACGNCGYAGYGSDFSGPEFTPQEKISFLSARIHEGLIPLEARLDHLSSDHAYYLAYLTRRHFKAPPEELGDLLLKASWCLRLDGGRPRDETASSRYRREAIREFRRAVEDPAKGAEEQRTFLYLVGELHRREGEFDEAVQAFTRFLEDPPDDVQWTRAAIGLKQRCGACDRSNFTFEEIARVVGPTSPDRF